MKSAVKAWMQKAARVIAAGYARNFHLEQDDIEQEAWAIMLKAELAPTFDPVLSSMETFASRAAERSLLRYCTRAKAPVTCGSSRNTPELYSLHRVSTESEAYGLFLEQNADPSAEAASHEERWPERVRAIVYEIIGTDDEVRAALSVIIGEATADEAAQVLGVPVRRFYPVVARVKEDLASSRELWAVWKER